MPSISCLAEQPVRCPPVLTPPRALFSLFFEGPPFSLIENKTLALPLPFLQRIDPVTDLRILQLCLPFYPVTCGYDRKFPKYREQSEAEQSRAGTKSVKKHVQADRSGITRDFALRPPSLLSLSPHNAYSQSISPIEAFIVQK